MQGQHKHTGNRCGHNPMAPRLALPLPAVDNTPWILKTLSERLDQYYDTPAGKLPSLNVANGSTRQQRSERREACVTLLKSCVKFLDLASLRVGIPTSDGFLPLSMDYLADQAGLSMSRADRAIADLKAANIITVSQPRYTTADGECRGLVAIRAISNLLFAAFGLGLKLDRERKRATKRLKIQARTAGKALSDFAKLHLLHAKEKPKPVPKKPWERLDRDTRARWMRILADVWHEHSDWPPDKLRQEAYNQL